MSVNNQIDAKKINLSKIIELLSSCGQIQDLMVNALVRHHEKTKLVCAKYFYEIYIYLDKQGTIFRYKDAEFNFLKDSDMPQETVDKMIINLNKSAQIKTADAFKSSFLALVRLYSVQPYRYLYTSVIVYYGVDDRLSHQTAIIVDLKQFQFIFYEPYGKYEKYNATYTPAILEFLMQYQFPSQFYENGKLRYTTWHQYFNLSEGIQTILLHAHNEKKEMYLADKDQFMQELQKTKPADYTRLNSRLENGKNRPAHKDDYTFDTLEIAAYFMQNELPKELEHMAMTLYIKYNSITCVTITLVEMNYYFTYLYSRSREEQLRGLKEYYGGFAANNNHKLLDELDIFIKDALNYERVHEWAKNPLSRLCDLL